MHKDIKSLISYSEGGILSKVITAKGVNTTLFCMAKGTEITEHTSTKKGIVYVIEGDGIFNLAQERIKMVPGAFIYMENDMAHSISADNNTSFLLLLLE